MEEEDDEEMEENEEQGEEEEVENDEEVDADEPEILAPKEVPHQKNKISSATFSGPRSPFPTTRRKGKTSPEKDNVLFMGMTESARAVKMREDLKAVLDEIKALKLKK